MKVDEGVAFEPHVSTAAQHLQQGCDCPDDTKETAVGFSPSPEPFITCHFGQKCFSSASAHSLSFPHRCWCGGYTCKAVTVLVGKWFGAVLGLAEFSAYRELPWAQEEVVRRG